MICKSSQNAGVNIFFFVLSSSSIVIAIIFNIINGIPNNGLFNNNIGNISAKYSTLITPASYAFLIWTIIYIFQVAMIIYYLSTLCRSNALGPVYKNPLVFPPVFHVCYFLANACNVGWMFTFDKENQLVAAILLLLITVFGHGALFANIKMTFNNRSKMEKVANIDLKIIYIVVQNGLDLYFTWCICATCISLSTVLQYSPEIGLYVSKEVSATISLCVLLLIILMLGSIDITVAFQSTRNVFTGYFVFIWALAGILSVRFDITDRNTILEIVAIIIVAAFLVVKIIFAVKKPHKIESPTPAEKA